MEYLVLWDDDGIGLAVLVNRYIKIGWKPIGGMAIQSTPFCLYQAMIKELGSRGIVTPASPEFENLVNPVTESQARDGGD